MKKVFRSLAIVVAGLSLLLSAQAFAAELKVGVVNMGKLLKEAPQAQAASKSLSDEFEPRKRQLMNQQQKLDALQGKLDKDGAVMSESERQDTQRQIQDLQRDFTRSQKEFMEDVNVRRNKALDDLQRVLLKEVQDFATENHYDLILGEGIFYASKTVDVTDQILARLQKAARAQAKAGKN